MDAMASPYRLAPDSPSRQLLWELNQLAISTQQEFYAQLDREDEEREEQHRKALAKASERHQRVREEAEQCRLHIEQQLKAECRRQQEDRQRELERLCQEQLEHELAAKKRDEKERAQMAELEEQRIAAITKAERDAADRMEAEKVRQDAEKTGRRAMVEQAAESRRREEAPASDSQDNSATNTLTTPTKSNAAIHSQIRHLGQSTIRTSALETEHRRYLEIHRRLKELRKGMEVQATQNAELKKAMGQMRREIRKCVGQIREVKEGKGTNRKPLQALIEVLKKAVTTQEPSVDVPAYITSPPEGIKDTKGPALLVYLLNIFAKAVVAQFINEAGPKPQIADPLGTVASHIFAVSHFRWQDTSLIDILIAKMHVVCPVLFGLRGDEQTVKGKQRLGWISENPGGPFIPQQSHFERMTGLSAGFAGISLKNYEKTQAKNPYPEYHYWQAMARVANVPPNEVTQTHLVILKGMIEGYEAKVLHFFGDAGLAILRHILIELPKRCQPSVSAKALAGLVDVTRRDKMLVL